MAVRRPAAGAGQHAVAPAARHSTTPAAQQSCRRCGQAGAAGRALCITALQNHRQQSGCAHAARDTAAPRALGGLRPPQAGRAAAAAGTPCCGCCGCTSCTPSSGLPRPPCAHVSPCQQSLSHAIGIHMVQLTTHRQTVRYKTLHNAALCQAELQHFLGAWAVQACMPHHLAGVSV